MHQYILGAPLLLVAIVLSIVAGSAGSERLHDAYGMDDTSAHAVLGEGETPEMGDPWLAASGLGLLALAILLPLAVLGGLFLVGRGGGDDEEDASPLEPEPDRAVTDQ